MKSKKDPSPTMHDPVSQSESDYQYRKNLEKYFKNSPGSNAEKLENFPKYVPRQALSRFLTRYEIFKSVLDIQGAIVECGVMFGGGLLSWAHFSSILEPYNHQRRIIGFDTFNGFPQISEQDKRGASKRKAKHLKKGGLNTSGGIKDLEMAINLYDENRFLNHIPKIEVIKGDFLKTGKIYLEDHPHLIISLLYLDFDIYQPTKRALEWFFPRIPQGGIIAFDQLNEEMYPGESIALLEQFNLNQYKLRRLSMDPRISYIIMGD